MKIISRIISVVILSSIVFGCTKKDYVLTLGYTLTYKGDSWQKQRTGLLWALSFLGATLPEKSLDQAITWTDSTTFKLDLKKLGFTPTALDALQLIGDSLKSSADYSTRSKTDLGQFIALTIGSSWHYYKIVDMPNTLREFYQSKKSGPYKLFPVTNSSVASHHRLIKYEAGSAAPTNWIFIAEEGTGNLDDSSFRTSVYEVFDILPNGQLRFGIYNLEGKLVAASPKVLGEAGKPAKCLWCHEIALAPLFRETQALPGFMSPDAFNKDMAALMDTLASYRKTLKSDVDFEKDQDHTQMELLYISFMQPSANRLMQEWGLSRVEVEAVLKAASSVAHHEFPFLGNLYNRAELKKGMLLYPQSVREPSGREINFFEGQQ